MVTTDTKFDLTEGTLEKLQQLIRINIDSERGLTEAARDVDDKMVAELFVELARQRANNARELQLYVSWNGEEAVNAGSYVAALHRVWLNVRSAVTGGAPNVILWEAERGEDAIQRAYEEALEISEDSSMRDVLERQFSNIQIGYDRVRGLRDQLAAH